MNVQRSESKSASKAILEQKYKVAVEVRQLAALMHGRGSEQWMKADSKCRSAFAKLGAAP